MYQLFKKSNAVRGVIFFLILCIMFTFFPLRIWKETIPSTTNRELVGSSNDCRNNYLYQRFIAQYDYIDTIEVYVTKYEQGWFKAEPMRSIIFRLFDSNMNIIFDEEVDLGYYDIPGFVTVYVGEKLEVGKDYYYYLQGDICDVWFGLEELENNGNQYVSRLMYNYEDLPGVNVISNYNYVQPIRKQGVLLAWGICILVMLALELIVTLYFKKRKERDTYVLGLDVLKATATPLIIAFGLAAFIYCVLMKTFNSGIIDLVVYTIGILLLCATLLYFVWRKRDRETYVPIGEKLSKNLPHILQAVFFAGVVFACNNYMNGLYDIHHRIEERLFMVFFALAVLCMTKKKYLFNKLNLVYLLVMSVAGVIVYNLNSVDIKDGDLGRQALLYGILAVIISGLVIITLILQFINKEKMAKLNKPFGYIIAAFFVLLLVFMNTRWWIVALVVSFTVCYLKFAMWEHRVEFINNFTNGLIINFFGSLVFSLMRRPFLAYRFTRFPFVFHTVTVTAVYLSIVLCAASVKFAMKLRKTGKLRACVGEAVIFSIVMVYSIFTCSRTGIFAEIVMLIVVFAISAFGKAPKIIEKKAASEGSMTGSLATVSKQKKKSAKLIALLMAGTVLSTVLAFPVVFTAQRIIPAMCHNIYMFEVEVGDCWDEIMRGNIPNSSYYVYFTRFFEVFNDKIFGIPEGGSNSFENTQAYQDYLNQSFDEEGHYINVEYLENLQQQNESIAASFGEGKEEADGSKDSENAQADNADANKNSDVASTDSTEKTGKDEKIEKPSDGIYDPVIAGNIISIEGADIKAEDLTALTSEEIQAILDSADPNQVNPMEDYDSEEYYENYQKEEQTVEEATEEYANGRIDIFKSYLANLNLTGHDDMGVPLPDGSMATHAHDIYLQVAFDNGIIVGVLFILVGVYAFISSVIFALKYQDKYKASIVPVAVIISFAIAGIVEWIFHLCHVAGFSLLIVIAPLIFNIEEQKDNTNESGNKNKKRF